MPWKRNPNHAGAAWNLAQLSLLTLDLPRAREYLRRYLSIEASGRIAKGLSHHESQTQIGQLLDEYELESAALAAMVAVWSQALMVHYFLQHGGRHCGPGSSRQRHDDSGDPSSDTE